MRDKTKKNPLGSADATGTAVPVSGTGGGGGGGSALASPPSVTASLLQRPKPGVIASPFGQVYLLDRTRPIAADAIQARTQQWCFDINGYTILNASVANQVSEYNAGSTLLSDWYGLARQLAKASLKYKHTPTTLNTPALFADYLNVAHNAIANMVALINLEHLYQLNQAFSTMYTYLPNVMSRVKRLYRRASTPFLPAFIKMQGIKDGMIPLGPGYVPHLRFWSENNLTMYGGGADYTDLSSETPDTVLGDATKLNNFVGNLEKMVWVLEGNVSYNANASSDVIAIKDLIDMMQDVIPGMYTQGLPDEKVFPGVMADKSLLNDWYCRALCSYDTKGVAGDVFVAYPAQGLSGFNNKIPIAGWGTPGMEEFTLLGGTKFVLLNDTPGTNYLAAGGKVTAYGTSYPVGVFYTKESHYTREDGWVAIDDTIYDMGDGASIRTWSNIYPTSDEHIYRKHLFAAQLGAALEWRFVDHVPTDYIFWMDEEDFGPNHALMLAAGLGIPYLKG